MPAIDKDDKAFSYGLSSSLSTKLFKVQYALQVFVKHNGIGNALRSMAEASMPIIIMTPSRNVMNTDKPSRKKHPRWEPYEYKLKEYALSD